MTDTEPTEPQPAESHDAQTPVALSLFGDDPAAAYEKMKALVAVIKQAFDENRDHFVEQLEFGRGARKRVQDHVTIEGWTFVGALVGVTARTTHTERVEGMFDGELWEDRPDGEGRVKVRRIRQGHGYKATAEAVTLGGSVVGGSIGMCLNVEDRWVNSDEYARSSMAQTRARSTAIAGVLRFLVEMAGFKGTPAAEMTGVVDTHGGQQEQRVEGPRRAIVTGWNDLMAKLDYVSGFTEGVSKGLLQHAAEQVTTAPFNGKKILKFGDLPREETMRRLHTIWWALEDGAGPLGVAPTDLIVEKWAELWPETEAADLAERIRAAAGEADAPSPDDPGIDVDPPPVDPVGYGG